MSTAPEVVVLLSGGSDSAACLHFIRDVNRPVCALFVDYGQPAAAQEQLAATAISRHYGVALLNRTLTDARPKSAGLITGRNAFLLFAALMERPSTATAIAIGVHGGTDYVDCSLQFVRQMDSLIRLCSNDRVSLIAPFVEWTKSDVWHYCRTYGVPIELTFSCENGGTKPCGTCLSCLDREALYAQA